jgi:hypothetical protein
MSVAPGKICFSALRLSSRTSSTNFRAAVRSEQGPRHPHLQRWMMAMRKSSGSHCQPGT